MTTAVDQGITIDTISVHETPQVSVIIAAYNCAPYLAGAIESALGQNNLNLEVIIVDDASTDETAEVARQYEKTGRVRLLVNEVNRGPSFTRNRAIQEARGEWVAQLDGDDWFAPGRIATLLQLAVTHRADLVADDLFMVEDITLQAMSTRFLDNGVPWHASRSVTPLDLIRYDLGSIKPLLRRSFLMEHALTYKEDVSFGEDFLLLLRAMLAGARVTILPEPMYHLRRGNTGSLTTQRNRLFHQIEITTKQLLSDPEINCYPEITIALTRRLKRVKRLAMLEEVIQLTKQRDLAKVFGKLLINPKLIFASLQRLPSMVTMRLRRRMHREVLKRAHLPPNASVHNIKSQILN